MEGEKGMEVGIIFVSIVETLLKSRNVCNVGDAGIKSHDNALRSSKYIRGRQSCSCRSGGQNIQCLKSIIEWITLNTKQGYRKQLNPGQEPVADFFFAMVNR